ncbi:hypothetical protein [Marinobacter caseinilyticus]|uniref:hypothetical protein n=1 Tax=Marinobacter caseinilyticus TaxID=2692195 RepID=UPI001A950C97|nr:hypothetical protein [Marinobacter caseinilyticus]
MTPVARAKTETEKKKATSKQWWLGIADLSAAGVIAGAGMIQRVHLSIADESFNLLARIPVTRPVSEPVRAIHHGLSRLSYGAVAMAAAAAQSLARSPHDPDAVSRQRDSA